MPIAYFAQAMPAHEPAFVDMGVNAVNAAFRCVLPNDVITLVAKNRRFFRVHGNHELVVVDFPRKVFVVEVAASVKQRLLPVGFLNHVEELEERVAKRRVAQPAFCLDVDHGYEVLIAGAALCLKVIELLLKFCFGAEEVI